MRLFALNQRKMQVVATALPLGMLAATLRVLVLPPREGEGVGGMDSLSALALPRPSGHTCGPSRSPLGKHCLGGCEQNGLAGGREGGRVGGSPG